jgi:allantoin racemase
LPSKTNKLAPRRIAVLGTGDAAAVDEQTPAPIRAAAGRGFQPELVDVPGAVFPATPEAREESARAYVAAGLAAEGAGYDALYINTVGDYGLQALRAVATIPVTGSGEGAIRQAGDRPFAIVTIWPPALRFIYDHVLTDTGATDQCRSIHHIAANHDLDTLGEPHDFVQEMQACSLTSMARIRAACETALTREGAELIVLGCTCMQPVAALLQAEGLPVIEAMVAGYQHMESLLTAA